MIHCASIPKPMQQMRVEIATYVHAGLLHAATYKYTCLYLWFCQFSMFLILNSLLHAVKLLCFEISIPSELQMTSDPLFSTIKDKPILDTILSSATIAGNGIAP